MPLTWAMWVTTPNTSWARASSILRYLRRPWDTFGNKTPALFPGLGAVELADSYDYEMTNAAEFNVTRRAAHGLTLLSNVVWMKTIDNTSSGTEGQDGPSNPFNLQSYRGVADFDQALRVTGSINYPLPHFNVNGVASALVNGWQANAIVTSQSGLPITITSGVDNSVSGVGNDLAIYNPGVSPARPAGASKITEWFNPAAFMKIRPFSCQWLHAVVRQRSTQLSARAGIRGHRHFAL